MGTRVPNSSQNNASEQGDYRSGGVGGVCSGSGSQLQELLIQTDAGLINWVVDKIYDRIMERREKAILNKDWAAPSHDSQAAGPAHYAPQYPWIHVASAIPMD